ncbi:hypothetical protein ACS0TY_030313 [Phlomoides rotata]
MRSVATWLTGIQFCNRPDSSAFGSSKRFYGGRRRFVFDGGKKLLTEFSTQPLRFLVGMLGDGRIRVFNRSLVVDHTGSRVLSGSFDNTVRLYDFQGMNACLQSFR